LAACLVLSWKQVHFWRNSETLFRQAVTATVDNPIARTGLGLALSDQRRTREAVEQFEAAIRIAPNYYYAQLGLGQSLLTEEKWPEAADHFTAAIQADAKSPDTHAFLGVALARMGREEEAAREFTESLRLNPTWPLASTELAWLRATAADPSLRNAPEAVRLAELAVAGDGGKEVSALKALDAAYAAAGRFPDAIAAAQKTRDAAQVAGKKDELDAAELRLELYRAGKAYCQKPE
jgi:tetratricopeptide (TPR) repeat protein